MIGRLNADVARVLVGGDTCPTGVNEKRFESGNASDILGDVASVVERSDLFVLNLECPLTASTVHSAKIGPNLKATPASAAGFAAMGVGVVGIANNHMMDFGEAGLTETITSLNESGVSSVGGGENLVDAWRIEERVINGVKIGIIAIAEREFGIASAKTAGVCPFDIIGFHDVMRAERHRFDHVVVLLHGGNEHYPYPRPGLVKSARFLASIGASAVICQHTHIVGSYEWYEGVPIIYGQGNFIFDYPTSRQSWSEGVLVSFTFTKKACAAIEFIPTTQTSSASAVSLLKGEDRARILDGLENRSKVLACPEELERKWFEYCKTVERYYFNSMHGRVGIIRRVVGRLGYLHLLESRRKIMSRLNIVRCESHREVLVSVLSGMHNK